VLSLLQERGFLPKDEELPSLLEARR
jgi:hypothetical protein